MCARARARVTLIICTEVEAETMHFYYNLTISCYVRDCIQFGEILVDLHVMLMQLMADHCVFMFRNRCDQIRNPS